MPDDAVPDSQLFLLALELPLEGLVDDVQLAHPPADLLPARQLPQPQTDEHLPNRNLPLDVVHLAADYLPDLEPLAPCPHLLAAEDRRGVVPYPHRHSPQPRLDPLRPDPPAADVGVVPAGLLVERLEACDPLVD